ncbi:GNAT family N-acetyltransferase [Corynebacterium sp. zg254]|uniref:GNAT family N-acetyltransferase n=1 Tax=Corynebacterium sp. zg254 TaxID=2656645 RepID=UPI002150A5E9|nr:GNAT family protein [Corynebacterium sp. zg254]MCR5913860.1 GNAT family N-acetyltransferase [Corynebacterium sp. zg254]
MVHWLGDIVAELSGRRQRVSTPYVRTTGQDPALVRLRDLRRGDGQRWRELRLSNEKQLRPVEPTVEGTWQEAHTPGRWRDTYLYLQDARRHGSVFPLVIEADGQFVGQLTLGTIQRGSLSNCWIGYWVAKEYSGRGIATAATALGTDFAMKMLKLHRVEATVLENNSASIAVLRKTGFRVEGRLQRNLHIDGRWQDHLLVAQTVEECTPGGVVHRLINTGRLRPGMG